MGRHMSRRPPKHVNGFIDRHGRPRYYLRRPGFKSVPLPGLPWSPEFMAAYEAALADQPRADVAAKHVRPGTMRALAISYFASPAFTNMADNSQAHLRRLIERFCRHKDQLGQPLGDKSAAGLQRQHIMKIIQAFADRKVYANHLRQALRALMQHAVAIGLREDDPTVGVKPLKIKTDGFHSWTEDEISRFERTHPIGSRARLAFDLLLYTGQRRSDVVRMGPQHIRNGAIDVKQDKTGTLVRVPIHSSLQKSLDAAVAGHLAFLVTKAGGPFKLGAFSNWFRKACAAAGLHNCPAHGLRKAAARRLAEAGCTPHEISAITGHRSLGEVARYTRAVEQKLLADSAMEKLEREHSLTNPDTRFVNSGKKP
jgi:integrase